MPIKFEIEAQNVTDLVAQLRWHVENIGGLLASGDVDAAPAEEAMPEEKPAPKKTKPKPKAKKEPEPEEEKVVNEPEPDTTPGDPEPEPETEEAPDDAERMKAALKSLMVLFQSSNENATQIRQFLKDKKVNKFIELPDSDAAEVEALAADLASETAD